MRQGEVTTENIDNILEEFCCKGEQRNGTAPRGQRSRSFFFSLSVLLCITFLRNLSQSITSLFWHSSHLSCYIYVSIFTYISLFKYNLIALVFVTFHYDQPLPVLILINASRSKWNLLIPLLQCLGSCWHEISMSSLLKW